MSIYDEIEQRIDAIASSGIDQVGSALSLAMAMKQSSRRPCEVFVVQMTERPAENSRAVGPALQVVEDTFGIVFAVRTLNDKDADRAGEKLESVRAVVRNSLFGWTPIGASDFCKLGPSDLIRMEPGQVWWLDRYKTEHQVVATQ